jgi:hypothetical protein
MKKTMVSSVVFVSFLAVPLMVMVMAQMPTPPKPLDTPMTRWMLGEWEGWMNSPMGKSQEWMACRMGLNNQFMMIEGSSKAGAMEYHGIGAVTVDPNTGLNVGYWIDNFRGMFDGKGKEEGNKLVMDWTGNMGKSTRITEKVGPDKMKITVEMPGADGKIVTVSGEMTRIKKTK